MALCISALAHKASDITAIDIVRAWAHAQKESLRFQLTRLEKWVAPHANGAIDYCINISYYESNKISRSNIGSNYLFTNIYRHYVFRYCAPNNVDN